MIPRAAIVFKLSKTRGVLTETGITAVESDDIVLGRVIATFAEVEAQIILTEAAVYESRACLARLKATLEDMTGRILKNRDPLADVLSKGETHH